MSSPTPSPRLDYIDPTEIEHQIRFKDEIIEGEEESYFGYRCYGHDREAKMLVKDALQYFRIHNYKAFSISFDPKNKTKVKWVWFYTEWKEDDYISIEKLTSTNGNHKGQRPKTSRFVTVKRIN